MVSSNVLVSYLISLQASHFHRREKKKPYLFITLIFRSIPPNLDRNTRYGTAPELVRGIYTRTRRMTAR